jgi:AcrR family transcriptional regulator
MNHQSIRTKPAAASGKRRLGRPPKATSQDSRTLILEAALDLFSTIGYEATTVRQIAALVGVSDPALYGHFESKSAIRERLFEIHGPKAIFSAMEKIDVKGLLSNPRDFARDRLHDLASRWFEPNEHKFFRFLMMENLKSNTEPSLSLSEIQSPMREKLMLVCSWLIYRKIAIHSDPEWMLGQFMSPIQTLRSQVAFNRDSIDVAQVKDRLGRHLDHFISVFLPRLSMVNVSLFDELADDSMEMPDAKNN